MTKDERQKAWNEGKVILRTRYDVKLNLWRKTRYSVAGGWKMYNNDFYKTKEECDEAISIMVKNDDSFIQD